MDIQDLDMGDELWGLESDLNVQYFGQSGYTPICLLAIDSILSSGCLPKRATIVSCDHEHDFEMKRQDHLFLFWNWKYFPLVVVPCAFSSGYSGEGPKGFSLAICMIRSKGIPIDGIFIRESNFRDIGQGRIVNVDARIFQHIKAKSEPLTFPWPLWVSEEDEELLARGQLWRKFYWRESRTDLITEAIADVDLYQPEAGKGLRLALDKLEKEETKEWQNAGLLIRDAWIELTEKLCRDKNIDTSDIRVDAAKERLKKLKLGDEIEKLTGSAFDLSLKIQHHRRIDKSTAITCIITTVVSMQTLIKHAMDLLNEKKGSSKEVS